jgi:acetylornithine deacetylase
MFERRTLPGEPGDIALTEANEILAALRQDDPEFEGDAKMIFGRDGYEIAASHPLPEMLIRAASTTGASPSRVGMTFWTDAAILGAAGIPSVLFGPGGAGLHSREEYVFIEDVRRCRDALVELVRAFV